MKDTVIGACPLIALLIGACPLIVLHLLVVDTKPDVVAKSIQLIAGRTAQEFNQRKKRNGAFWEDRYYVTAVEGNEYLARCLVYIDLNMVTARQHQQKIIAL